MIPLAKKLREMNNNIIIGTGDRNLALFQNEFPELTYISFPGFRPGYSRFLPPYLSILMKTPLLLFHIFREHFMLKKIIRKHNIDIVISDNRFGLWNRNVMTVYVTHMPLIPLPKPLRFLEFIGIFLHRNIIKRYSFCFIPDLPGELNVSGRLSHGLKLTDNVRYIGILSRFEASLSSTAKKQMKYATVILSGPEPQREILRHKLIARLKNEDFKTVILEGKPGKKIDNYISGNITFYNHLPAQEMRDLINGSDLVLTRSGYTTIMELISLKCSALLIPTPGQTEQEYLAEYLSEKGWFSTITQSEIETAITFPVETNIIPGEITEQSNILLTKVLEELLEHTHKNS
jgi:hypothetical protein